MHVACFLRLHSLATPLHIFSLTTSKHTSSWSGSAIVMAIAERPKYMWIPPPPLPEFYLPKDKVERVKALSSSSSGTDADDNVIVEGQKKPAKAAERHKAPKHDKNEPSEQQPAVPGDGAYDGLPPPPYPHIGVPQPPTLQAAGHHEIPPLAVYHICRICLRPRSARYHREHPIPVNGVPPPPGICRRCRVSSVKENSEIDISEVDEVVRKGRSNDIKIGMIAPFVPSEAMISNEEAKRMQAQRYLRGRSRERHITIFREASSESQRRYRRDKSRRSDIVYRHVRVVEEPETRRKTVENFARENDTRKRAKSPQVRVRYEREDEKTSDAYVEPKSSKSRPPLKSANLAKLDSAKASDSSRIASSASSSTAAPTGKVSREPVMLKRPERTDSEIRDIANEEARRYAADMRKNERTESDIRRIAHEEVTRYREAERKLEARPGAFAHGRLVPVHRGIDEEQVTATIPTPVDAVEPPARSQQGVQSGIPDRSASGQQPESCVRSDPESWGPQWRRELSLERRRSSGLRGETLEGSKRQEIRTKASAPHSDLALSDNARSGYNVAPDAQALTGASHSQTQDASEMGTKPIEHANSRHRVEDTDMCLPFSRPPDDDGRNYIRTSRQTVRLVTVNCPAPAARRGEVNTRAHDKPKRHDYGNEGETISRAASQSSRRWETSGSGGTPFDREPNVKQQEPDDDLSRRARMPPQDKNRDSADEGRRSDGWYEYRRQIVRPADQPQDRYGPEGTTAPPRSKISEHVVRENRQRALDGSRGPPRNSPSRSRRPSPRQHAPPRDHSPSRSTCTSPRQSAPPRDRSPARSCTPHPRGSTASTHAEAERAENDAEGPDRDIIVEVWQQVPSDEAERRRRDTAPPSKEAVIDALKQAAGKGDGPASSACRDSAMETPPARRRRERREAHKKASNESNHVKFANELDISPTPPGSDESSSAFRRFHDFGGRRTTRQQIDGHDSEERGEDLIAEYERRGRSRSREQARRKSHYGYERPDLRDRDETVKPREGQRQYDGRRDDGWRRLQRALSESPSRELSDRKRSSIKRGPPYHPEERPTPSMTTRDGSRDRERWW